MKGLGIFIVIVALFGLLFGAGLPNVAASGPASSRSRLPEYDKYGEFGWRWPQTKPHFTEDHVGLQMQAADTARGSSPLDLSRVLVPVATVTVTPTLPLREISYYPKDYAWSEFWRHWPQAKLQMDADLDRIKALGANTVRIFLQPDVFGYPIPNSISMSYFNQALALIDAHHLQAHVTLFDCWQCWGDVSRSQTWLRHLVQPHRNDVRIAVWELRNEVGLDKPDIRAWVQAVFPVLKEQAGSTACTVSVSNVEWLDDVMDLTGSPDIYSLHWYPGPEPWTRPFPTVIDKARELIGAAPLLIGEFGLSTYAYSDISQADLYTDVLYYAHQKGIDNLGAWTLNDFSPGAIGCNGPITKTEELYFGLYRTDGSPKPAEPILQAAFHGNPPSQLSPVRMYNTSFEDLNRYSGYLDNWWPWDEGEPWTGTHWETQDCTMAHSGHCSVRLSPSVTMSSFVTMTVGLYNVPALPVVSGRSFDLKGYVQTRNLDGYAVLALSWFSDTHWLGNTESQRITATNLTQWTPISMHDVQPLDGANYVEVFVKMKSTDPTSVVWFDDVIALTERVRLPLIHHTAQ